jgi:hypothetical protein
MPLTDIDFRKAEIFDAYAQKIWDAKTPAELKAAVTAVDDLKDGGLDKLAALKEQAAIAASAVREATAETLADKLSAFLAASDAIKDDPIIKDVAVLAEAKV